MGENQNIVKAYNNWKKIIIAEKNKFIKIFESSLENYPLYEVMNTKEFKNIIREIYTSQQNESKNENTKEETKEEIEDDINNE